MLYGLQATHEKNGAGSAHDIFRIIVDGRMYAWRDRLRMLVQAVESFRQRSDVDGEEWQDFSDHIQEHFRTNYDNFSDEFYFWNDFSGDRTLDLKIAKSSVLTSRLGIFR